VGGRRGIPENANPRCLRHGFLEDFLLLGDEIGEKLRQPSDISAGPSEARHVPDADGVSVDSEHDGNRFGRLLGSLYIR
jgi:hypothetical protein